MKKDKQGGLPNPLDAVQRGLSMEEMFAQLMDALDPDARWEKEDNFRTVMKLIFYQGFEHGMWAVQSRGFRPFMIEIMDFVIAFQEGPKQE